MKFVLIFITLAICAGIEAAPASGKLVYPWTEWLKLRATTPAPVAPAEESDEDISQDEFLNFLSRSIFPKVGKPGKDSKTSATTTKKPSLVDVGDFWSPPTIAPNVTSPEVIDPSYWAAKKTMFISKLFAALAKQVLNSTGEVTTTTASPQDSLLKEIDTVLLSDAARSIAEDTVDPPTPSKALMTKIKAAMKKEAKKTLKKKPTPKPSLLPFWAALNPTPEPGAEASETTTPHPTLDYAQLAKALIS